MSKYHEQTLRKSWKPCYQDLLPKEHQQTASLPSSVIRSSLPKPPRQSYVDDNGDNIYDDVDTIPSMTEEDELA